MKLSIEEQIKAVERWQKCDFVHPLTCGNNSNHNLLVPKKNGPDYLAKNFDEEDDNEYITLDCPDCDWVQSYIPDCVFSLTHFKIEKLQKLYDKLTKEE